MEDANVALILKEIAYIKEHMLDMDRILTDEELIMLKEATRTISVKKKKACVEYSAV